MNLWQACPKWQAKTFLWQAAFNAVPNIFIYFAQQASLFCEIYVYMHISDRVHTVHELPFLSNNNASETFVHKSGALRSVDWIFITGVPA